MDEDRYTLGQAAACTGVSAQELALWRHEEGIRVSHTGYTADQILQIISAYPLVDETKIRQGADQKAARLYDELKNRRK